MRLAPGWLPGGYPVCIWLCWCHCPQLRMDVSGGHLLSCVLCEHMYGYGYAILQVSRDVW
jgi:hypothetical protein